MIIGVDPGYTTGVCVIDNVVSGDQFNVIAAIEVSWSTRFEYFTTLFSAHHGNVSAVVIERFKLTANDKMLRNQIGSEMPSSRVIGLVELECYRYKLPLIIQNNYDYHNMRILPQHRTIVGLSRHNQVAYRHLRYYLRMNGERVI